MEFYNYRYHNNCLDLLLSIQEHNKKEHNIVKTHIKKDYWNKQYYSTSIHYLNALENFSQAGGIQLIISLINANFRLDLDSF